jgi:hypothetical protein
MAFQFLNSAGDQITMIDNEPKYNIYIYKKSTGVLNSCTFGGITNTNGWAHFVFTATSTGTYTGYLNKTAVYTQTAQLLPTNNTLYTGNIGDGVNQPSYVPGYTGYIDEFRVFNTCLTAQQVTNLYNSNTI